jgi:hypothetical protein
MQPFLIKTPITALTGTKHRLARISASDSLKLFFKQRAIIIKLLGIPGKLTTRIEFARLRAMVVTNNIYLKS